MKQAGHKVKRTTDTQWRRYSSKYGEIAIPQKYMRSERLRGIPRFIPRHTPVVSVPLTRSDAAIALRIWRKLGISDTGTSHQKKSPTLNRHELA